jgi:hypothetical protein
MNQPVDLKLVDVEKPLAGFLLSPQGLDELTMFAAEIRRKLAGSIFAGKGCVSALLDTRVVLKMVGGQRYADVTCKLALNSETLPVESSSRQRPKGGTEPSTVSTSR